VVSVDDLMISFVLLTHFCKRDGGSGFTDAIRSLNFLVSFCFLVNLGSTLTFFFLTDFFFVMTFPLILITR